MSQDRRAAVEALQRLAFCAELLDVEFIHPPAVSGLAWALRSAEGSTEDLYANGTLEQLQGMSAALWAIVDDALHGRDTPALLELERAVPPGLLEVRKIKGLGARKIHALWKELEITSLGELEYACRENRLVTLKGFGDKTQRTVLDEIARLRAQVGLMRLDVARELGARVVAALAPARAVLAGEARRGCELVSSVVVVTTADPTAAQAAAATVEHPISALSVRAEGFGWALLEATGAPAHVELLRTRAAARGVALEQCGDSEEQVYAALGLVPTDVERREAGVPLVEKGAARPRLIQREDLRGALHNHTTASDGVHTLEEMRAAAAVQNLQYLGITDHSRSASYARGLDVPALVEQRAAIDALNADGAGCVLLSGVESDILRDGALDYADAELRPLDVVVASVHNRFGQRGAPLTERMLAAARHRFTDVVGHPTGRLLLGRAPAEYDVPALLALCADVGCAVELNANPARLDLSEHHLAEAKARGVLVSIAADAHSTEELDHLHFGISVARRAGLAEEDVLNTRTLPELRAWLAARRARVGAGDRL